MPHCARFRTHSAQRVPSLALPAVAATQDPRLVEVTRLLGEEVTFHPGSSHYLGQSTHTCHHLTIVIIINYLQ